MRFFTIVAAGALATCLAGPSLGHGGGLNKDGCHNDRRSGGYHSHRSPAAAPAPKPVTPPPSRAVAATKTSKAPAPVAAGGPKCYVGPRGGTYTITKSGRKNYSGC